MRLLLLQRLFTNTTIKPYQDLICDCLDEIFAVNNISLNLYFKTIEPLEFKDLENVENEEQKEEETGVKEEDNFSMEMLLNKPDKCCLSEEDDFIFEEVLSVLSGDTVDLKEYEIADIRDGNR